MPEKTQTFVVTKTIPANSRAERSAMFVGQEVTLTSAQAAGLDRYVTAAGNVPNRGEMVAEMVDKKRSSREASLRKRERASRPEA